MSLTLEPYPKYSDSGIAWLGQMPDHWKRCRIKNIFRESDRRSMTGEGLLLSLTRLRGLIPQSTATAKLPSAADLGKYKVCMPGELVMNRMQAWSGMFAIAQCEGLVSPDYSVFNKIPNLNVEYFEYLFKSPIYVQQFAANSKGVGSGFNRLYTPDFTAIPVCIPPFEEQTDIAIFIRRFSVKFARLIRAKRRVIELLNEQKRAIIHDLITQGVGSASLIQPVDNEWFPKIPAGWSLVTLRRVIKQAIDGPHFSPKYVDSGVPFISARNIRIDRWSLDDAKFVTEEDYEEFSKRVVPLPGDVLYTKGGTTGVARVVDLPFRFQVWVHVAVLKIRTDRAIPEYLALALNSPKCYEQSQLFTRGATNQDLGLNRMKNIILPLPPDLKGQRDIVEQANRRIGPVNAATHDAEQEIALLREYRTRLIADVVTGKLDVRRVQLPEIDPDELESLAEVEEDAPDSETELVGAQEADDASN